MVNPAEKFQQVPEVTGNSNIGLIVTFGDIGIAVFNGFLKPKGITSDKPQRKL